MHKQIVCLPKDMFSEVHQLAKRDGKSPDFITKSLLYLHAVANDQRENYHESEGWNAISGQAQKSIIGNSYTAVRDWCESKALLQVERNASGHLSYDVGAANKQRLVKG